jgi:hypothetical protein
MLLLIDNYDSFTYNLVHYLGELGAEVEVVRNDALSVDAALARRPAAVVMSPGPCTPDEAGICVDLVRAAPPGLPILCVRLGHHAIGQALGGEGVRCHWILPGMLSPVLESLIDPFGTSAANIGLMISFFTAPAIVVIPIAGVLGDPAEVVLGCRDAGPVLYGLEGRPGGVGVLEGLLRDADRFDEEAELPHVLGERDEVLGRVGEELGHVAVVADDAALDVLALGGHVRFAALEVLVRALGRRAPDCRDDDVALS